jgi:hypothetical protein
MDFTANVLYLSMPTYELYFLSIMLPKGEEGMDDVDIVLLKSN